MEEIDLPSETDEEVPVAETESMDEVEELPEIEVDNVGLVKDAVSNILKMLSFYSSCILGIPLENRD